MMKITTIPQALVLIGTMILISHFINSKAVGVAVGVFLIVFGFYNFYATYHDIKKGERK